jgi:hypothetical protein
MEYVSLLGFFLILGISVFSLLYYLPKYLGSRMNLQDLRLHGKPHRQLLAVEKQHLMAEYESLERISKGLGAPLIPLSDEVYLIQGEATGFGIEAGAAKITYRLIDGIPVEIPYPLVDRLVQGTNVAEVAIGKRNAVVLSLNGTAIAQMGQGLQAA